jgi:hypothetical protein
MLSLKAVAGSYIDDRPRETTPMARIKVHGGDFVPGASGSFSFGVLRLPTPGGFIFGGIPLTTHEQIPLSKLMRVEAINKEMKHRTGAAVGRGLLGATIAGPIGSVAGVLFGGPLGIIAAGTTALVGFTTTNHKSEVTFEAEFEGGRRLLATTNTATYIKLLAAAFDYKPPQEQIGNVNDEPDNDVQSSGVALPAVNSAPPTEVQAKIDLKLLVAYMLGIFVLIGIINRSPLAWGIAVAGIVFIVGRTIWPR